MRWEDIKEGNIYYIPAKYLRGFETYFKNEDSTKKVTIQIIENSSGLGWYTMKATCKEYKNPKTLNGSWYIEGKYVKHITEDEIDYKYYLKVYYTDDKYGDNRYRIIETDKQTLIDHNVFVGINACRDFYLALESKTNKYKYEIVRVMDICKRAIDINDNPIFEFESQKKWFEDEQYYPGILDRKIVKEQNILKGNVRERKDFIELATIKSNNFFEQEYDRLTDELCTAKNDNCELKVENKELKDISEKQKLIIQGERKDRKEVEDKYQKLFELKNKSYIELLKKYNELHDSCSKTEDYNSNYSNNKVCEDEDTNVYGSKLSDVKKIKELEATINDLKLMLAERDLELYKLKKDR